jgi:TRAP-type C4-dicarboxylate transport system substrate-binding protein
VYRRGWDMFNAEVAPFNVKLLSYNAAQPHVICTKDKPIRTLEDVKGLKIRGAGGLEDMMLEAVGAIPVTMSSSDVYLAIQTGVLDGGCSLPTSPDAHPWGDLVQYMTLTNHMYVAGATMINLDTWNKMTPELQEIVIDASRDMEDHNIAFLDQMFEESIAKWEALSGKEVLEFSDVERAKWKDLCTPIWDEWVSNCEAAGKGDQARQLLQIIEEVTG